MNEYIKEENIVKNEVYEALKDDITCQICFKLMILPMVCPNCQNTICNKCVDDWKKKGGTCPNGCKSEFQKVIEKNNHIFKIKFKCIKGCGKEILFGDLAKHSSDCINSSKNKKMTRISREELFKMKEKNIEYFTSKKI